MRSNFIRSRHTRIMALALVTVVLFSASLPELGNLLAYRLWPENAHYFNKYFLVAGLVACLVCGYALCRR